jgi:biopolymer transport protein ExbD
MYYDMDHIGVSSRLDVYVIDNKSYIIGDGLSQTNASGLTSCLQKRQAACGSFPLIIWAKEDARFEEVWHVMELGSTNKSYYLTVREKDTPRRKNFTLPRRGRSWGNGEHYISCGNPLFMESSSNKLVIVCEKDLLTVDNMAYSIEELRRALRIRRYNSATSQILILATADCPYQKVIHVLEACEMEGLSYRYLGFHPTLEPGKGVSSDNKPIRPDL